MSRVRDNQRRDAERIAEEQRQDQAGQKSRKEDGGKFSKMMEGKKTTPQSSSLPGKTAPKSEAKPKTTPMAGSKKPAETAQPSSTNKSSVQSNQTAKTTTSAGQKNLSQNALLARQGIANNRFSSTLTKEGNQSVSELRADAHSQSEEVSEAKEHFNEEQTQINRDEQQGHQRLEAISRDDQSNSQGMGSQDPSGEEVEQLADSGAAISPLGTPTAASAAQTPAGPPQLPSAMVQEIVKRVLVGTNTEGISQFHIEFKDDVLGGVRLEVSSDNGKVKAKFITDDVNIGRLLKASEGQLSRAFGHKGLNLDRLEVESP